MPYVTCPTCGERGKIPSNLIGARIKCRKCGLSFQVSPPAPAKVGGAAAPAAMATTGPSAPVEAQGIEVEGLDASSWAVPTETAMVLKVTEAEHAPDSGHEASPSFSASASGPAGPREYKIITSRDKMFEGKFDLARLEEALNHYARQGWVARSMIIPHLKAFTGVLEEVIVVLLERVNTAWFNRASGRARRESLDPPNGRSKISPPSQATEFRIGPRLFLGSRSQC